MLTLFTIFIAVAGAGFAFWFYNKRQVKNLADQIEDKNAVITAFRNHVEETSTQSSPIVDDIHNSSFQKKNSQQKSKNGVNKNRQNGQKKSSEQKNQPSHAGKPSGSQEKKNRPNKQRKPKPQQ